MKQFQEYPPFKTTREMHQAYRALDSRWSGESILNTRMLLWLCEFFEATRAKPKQKRPLSKWQEFFGAQVKAGKTAKEAAEAWRKKK